MARGGRREERLMWRWIGKGSRRGSSWPSRVADILRRPYVWAGCVTAISVSGPRGRRAALRGVLCAGTSSTIHLLVKPLLRRRRPRGAQLMRLGPVTSSFPSGHTATDLGFTFGASQEMPVLMAPLSILTLGSHWSLIRSREHYPSDVVAGGALAFAVAVAAWRLSPPQGAASRGRA